VSQYNPAPVDAPLRSPLRQPKRVVPSYIGEVNQVLNLLMYKGAGDTVKDYSGHGNDGEFRGDPQWTDEYSPSWALSFDGANDCVEVPSDPSLNPDYITILTWIRPDTDWDGSEVQRVNYKVNQWTLAEHTSYPPWYVGFYDGADWYRTQATDNPLTAGDWYHLAATYDGSTMYLYLDGTQIGSTSWTGTINETTNNLGIGSDVGLDFPFPGEIGDARIYSGALGGDKVKAHYEATKALYGV